jgi:hypothetical protein
MTNLHSNPTPLRQKFIEYLTLNRKAERTVHTYVSFIYPLARHCRRSPDLLGPEDIRQWLYHLIAERKQAASTVNLAINRLKALTLTGVEFIRRLRLHLLPRGFTKIRHYGLLGNNRRHRRVPQARTALATSPLRFAPAPTPRPVLPPLTCPHCQGTDVRCIGRVERSGKVSLFARPWLSGRATAYADTS